MTDATKPLTDEELALIEAFVRDRGRGELPRGNSIADSLYLLVAEVHRLRAEAKMRVETERFGFTADAAVGAVVGSSFLQQELDRLRSDEWLERAADEIEGGIDDLNETGPSRNEILAILRKHRGGKA
jgi:hypothetical protein